MKLALGLAAGLFLGCQQFLGQEDKAPAQAGASEDAPAEMALRLAMKETEACRALRAQMVAADAGGEAAVTLQTDFIRNCIEEIRSSDSAGRGKIPADLVPDDRIRCRWLISEIEGGREELVIKFRYYCPDDCDTLEAEDSVRHGRICRDTVRPPKDTLVTPTRCDSLRLRMGALDPASEEFFRLKHQFQQFCVGNPPVDTLVYPPIDTLPPRPLPLCDSLRIVMSTLDPASAEFARLKQHWYAQCVEPTPVDPPRDSVFCEGLLARMSGMEPTSPDHVLLKERWTLLCTDRPVDPIEPVDPVHSECDAIRKRMESVDPASADHAYLRGLLPERCGFR